MVNPTLPFIFDPCCVGKLINVLVESGLFVGRIFTTSIGGKSGVVAKLVIKFRHHIRKKVVKVPSKWEHSTTRMEPLTFGFVAGWLFLHPLAADHAFTNEPTFQWTIGRKTLSYLPGLRCFRSSQTTQMWKTCLAVCNFLEDLESPIQFLSKQSEDQRSGFAIVISF